MKQKVKKKTKTQLVPVVITVVSLSLFMVIFNANLSNLMNNSVSNYYCNDSYELKNNMCVKEVSSELLILGDIDKDNKITENDINIISNYINNNTKLSDDEMLIVDVDNNYKLDNTDIKLIKSYVDNNNYKYICPVGYKLKDDICLKTIKEKALTK